MVGLVSEAVYAQGVSNEDSRALGRQGEELRGREDSQSLCPPRVTVGEPRAAPLASSGRLEQKLLGEPAPPPPRWDW